MKTILSRVGVVASCFLLAFSFPASAAVKLDFSSSLSAGDPTQKGRLFRTGIPSEWSAAKTFPGVSNATLNHHYHTITLPAASIGTARFIQISVESNTTLLVSAYQTEYLPDPTPANRGLDVNYLGDVGSSGLSFGNPRFFQAAVPAGRDLVIVVNEVDPGTGVGVNFRLLVEGFTDTQYSDPPHFAFLAGKKPADLAVLTLDPPPGTGEVRTINAVSGAALGTVTINPDGTLAYVPDDELPPGGDEFTYTVSDGLDDFDIVKVEVHDYADLAGLFDGLIHAPPGTTPDNERTGSLRVKLTKAGKFTGKLVLATGKFSVKGGINNLGVTLFGKAAEGNATLERDAEDGQPAPPDLAFSFQLGALDQIFGKLTETGTDFAVFTGDRALYNKNNPFPEDKVGIQTLMFTSPVPNAVPAPDIHQFPQGTGFGLLKLGKKGVAKLVGKLADGTPFSSASPLAHDDSLAFYAPLFKGQGSISGPAILKETPGMSDFNGLGLQWFKAAGLNKQKAYPDGWPAGLTTNVLGSIYVAKQMVDASVLPGLDPAENAGPNADVFIEDGNLPATIDVGVDVTTKNKVLVLTEPADLGFKAGISGGKGLFKASFVHSLSGKKIKALGVIFQEQGMGVGFFVDPDSQEAGSVTLIPK
ncbi:MAG: hypothetical protein QOE70_2169 [Chthoniobacter sp.]|jgi:hypothetical protein|nr:hypothetical protein [Chthoniobacter sp.]